MTEQEGVGSGFVQEGRPEELKLLPDVQAEQRKEDNAKVEGNTQEPEPAAVPPPTAAASLPPTTILSADDLPAAVPTSEVPGPDAYGVAACPIPADPPLPPPANAPSPAVPNPAAALPPVVPPPDAEVSAAPAAAGAAPSTTPGSAPDDSPGVHAGGPSQPITSCSNVADPEAETAEEPLPPSRPAARPFMPPRPHELEHADGWTPIELTLTRIRRTVPHAKPTRRMDVLLSCSDGDMPEFIRHRGTATVFQDTALLLARKQQAQQQDAQRLAHAARMQSAVNRQTAAEAQAEEAAANRAHGYSTRKRNATRNFKDLYPDLLAAEDDDEGDEDEKLAKVATDESSSESGMESDDSEIGRRRKVRRPAPSRPAHQVHRQHQPARPQQQQHQEPRAAGNQQTYMQQQLKQQQQQHQHQQLARGNFNPAMQHQAALLHQQQQQQNAQLQQLMQTLSQQEQQIVLQAPAVQRAQTIVALVQQKRARQLQQQQQQQQQQHVSGMGQAQQRVGLEALGFVPSGGVAGGAVGGRMSVGALPQSTGGMYGAGAMRQGQQQGLGLQLPGMLGQQQPSNPFSPNPFTGGGTSLHRL